MKDRYQDPIILVNLINQRGAESVLHRALTSYINDLADPAVRLVNWDFHHHCQKMQWHNVSLLMDELDSDLNKIGYFEAFEQRIDSVQKGIIRTNCMDCLDRTNVVQSLIAKQHLLQVVLTKWKLQITTDQVERALKHVWADNADAISQQYSGTGALKTDYTRTGKRTIMGQWRDLVNSIQRYIKGNLMDADRQDAMDLFFGAYSVIGSPGAAGIVSQPVPLVFIPLTVIVLTVVLILRSLLTKQSPIGPLPPTVAAVLLSLVLAVTIKMVLWNGSVFVRLPRLCPPPPPVTMVRGVRSRPSPGLKAHII